MLEIELFIWISMLAVRHDDDDDDDMYKNGCCINNLQCLMCHQTEPNHCTFKLIFLCSYFFGVSFCTKYYYINYCDLIRMTCTQLYGFKYSYLILIIIWFQIFLSNINNYMVSSNFFSMSHLFSHSYMVSSN